MSKHTPMPWTHSHFGVSGRTADGKALLADCYNRLIPTSEMRANTRLIAAAPEMLEALKASNTLLSLLADGGDHVDTQISDNDELIAKAEGRR